MRLHLAMPAVVCALPLVLAAAPAGASTSGWSVQHTINYQVTHGDVAGVSCPSVDLCVAVGSYVNSVGVKSPLVESWNGTTWTIQGSPAVAGQQASLTAVSCASALFCAGVGSFTDARGHQRPLAELWNGSSWAVAPTPWPSGAYAVLTAVSCASATSCMGVGRVPVDEIAVLAARLCGALEWDGLVDPQDAGSVPRRGEATLGSVVFGSHRLYGGRLVHRRELPAVHARGALGRILVDYPAAYQHSLRQPAGGGMSDGHAMPCRRCRSGWDTR